MKLSVKIFLGICIPAIVSITVISNIFISLSLKSNIEAETERGIKEFRVIESNIETSITKSSAETKFVIKSFADYYSDNSIDFVYYEDEQEKYKSSENLVILNEGLLYVREGEVLTLTQKTSKNNYILISTRLSNENVLIYAKDINNLYSMSSRLRRISIILMVIMLIIIAIIAYVISKTLTKPLRKMQTEMKKLSNGDYNINLKEGHDEIGTLAKNFKNMSKELENRNNELVNMINSKQVFIDNLSHEINTPLTSIIGYSELLEKANCSEEQKIKFLGNIQKEAKRINDIHKKLLLLSYKANADLEKVHNNYSEILDEIKHSIRFKLEENNINLEIENSLEEIYGDKTLIILSISNLISNAIYASKRGSKILLRSFNIDKNACVQVIDEGKGISKENIDRIIEPFYRVDKARSRKNGGAGLGLSICKSIMELHNGNMSIESELGKGSCFTLRFPQK